MSWGLILHKKAEDDLKWYKRNNQKLLKKCEILLKEIIEDPKTGTGKPEPLKYCNADRWSRRIDKQNRIVYEITSVEGEDTIIIISCKGHYD